MQRALVLVVLVVGGCRMNFDPLEEGGAPEGETESIGSTQTASTITAPPGSELSYDCRPGQPCMVDCSEALSCIVDCAGASTCDVMCAPAGCIVQTCIAPSCEVDCGVGQKTVINDAQYCTTD